MIAQIYGKLIERKLPWVTVETSGGVAYEIQVPMSTAYDLPEMGQSVRLYTHLVIREDAQELCGFLKEDEREIFRILLKANGIGPKSALGVLSGMPLETFVETILSENVGLLTSIPGIGKKTAERLVVDIKERVQKWSEGNALPLMSGKPSKGDTQAVEEAVSALQALGYREGEVRTILKKSDLLSKGHTAEHMIRYVLKAMIPGG